MCAKPSIVRVAVPAPLSRRFDYLLSGGEQHDALIGARVEVPFGRGSKVGVVVEHAETSAIAPDKLKPVKRLLDCSPAMPEDMLQLIDWASRYYHCPIGEAIATALPAALRKAKPDDELGSVSSERGWRLTDAGSAIDPATLGRAPLRRKVLQHLKQHPGCGGDQLSGLGTSWRQCLTRLSEAGLVERCDRSLPPSSADRFSAPLPPTLNNEQQVALEALRTANGKFQPFLLEGVTGSGKTEVYLRCAREVIDSDRQVLVIVPEIGLTPQLVARFTERFGDSVVALHSGLNDTERLRNWRRAAQGRARIVVGTRSSVFVPLQSLGLIVIDEEHDSSLKQQDGFRYHARDLALVRARNANVPIILGSATPSLETLHNSSRREYAHLTREQRAGNAKAPSIELLDVRRNPLNEGLAARLVDKMRRHLQDGNQVMLFLNRRGYAPTMLCDDCGTIVDCKRCDAHMTVHAASKRMRCHHCGSERPIPDTCDTCDSRELAMAGQGTERIDYALRALFPEQKVVRIDRDTTRRKGSLQAQLEEARSGRAGILVGTQMLAKGHHFPHVTLVALLDVDRGLFGVDFRAAEQMAQTIVQVAGRAGREAHAGEVVIQTRNPDNPLFQTLIHQGYSAFARLLLDERKALALPPYRRLALLRAEAVSALTAKNFLQSMRERIGELSSDNVSVLGPAAAPIERVAGRYRAQLLLSSTSRKSLHGLLGELRLMLETMRESRKVRWSLDVDPIDLM